MFSDCVNRSDTGNVDTPLTEEGSPKTVQWSNPDSCAYQRQHIKSSWVSPLNSFGSPASATLRNPSALAPELIGVFRLSGSCMAYISYYTKLMAAKESMAAPCDDPSSLYMAVSEEDILIVWEGFHRPERGCFINRRSLMEGKEKSHFRKVSLYSNILACFQVGDASDQVVQNQNGTTLPLQDSLVDLENNYIFDRRSKKNSILLRVQRDRTMRRLSSLKRTFLGAKEVEKRSSQALYSMVESVPLQLKTLKDLCSPVSSDCCMVCIIKVEPSGALDLNPIYRIYSASKGEFLLSARKVGAGFTQYAISSSPKLIDPTKKWCVGRLRSNIFSTEWVLQETKQESGEEAETLLVTYKTNLFGLGGPRELTISILTPPSPNYEKPVSSIRSPTNLRQSLKHSSSQVLVYSSRKPEYDQARRKYRLRIGNGDVDEFDQKNLILEKEGEVPLICGRLSAESFYVQIQSSLSPLQAFAVCLSNFDKKLWVQ